MPTNKPRVQGYVPQEVFDRLEGFKDTHGLKSTSEAVTLALEGYFGIKQVTGESPVNQENLLRLDSLEMQVASLYEELARVTQTIVRLEDCVLATQGKSPSNLLVSHSKSSKNEQVSQNFDGELSRTTNSGEPSKTKWSVYLHHPRGTVERIAGPFPDVEQAQREIDFQKSFGLFSEAKGYLWERREENEATVPNQQPKASELADTETDKGLKLAEVATRLGKNYSALRLQKAKLGAEAFLEFLKAETGHPWRFDSTTHRYGLYFPS